MISTNRSRVLSERFFQGKGGPVLAVIVLVVLLVGPATVLAVDNLVVGGVGGNAQVEQEEVNVSGDPGAQVNEEAQELMDIDLPEDAITFFDPDSIPESAPLPDTTWVFQVPVDVTDLPDEVQKIGVICNVYEIIHTDSGNVWINPSGKAKTRIDVVNAAVSQTVIIGVQGAWDRTVHSGYGSPWNANRWECKMYLIGPDHSWKIPSTDVVNPAWRRADPGEPFRWHAGPHPLPEEARVADPEG